MIEEKKKYCVNADFILREIKGEYVVISAAEHNLLTKSMLFLNETAVFIWKKFEQSNTIKDVVMQAAEEYDISENQLDKVVQNFTRDMITYGIFEEVK